MRKMLIAAAALGGLFAMTATHASAAPSAAALHVAPAHGLVTSVDYYYDHHHYHHRHWQHGHWHYY
nr:hypothetical protein [uncultured Rhodopila sp.]